MSHPPIPTIYPPQEIELAIDKVDEWAIANVRPSEIKRRRPFEIKKCLEGETWRLQIQREGRRYLLQKASCVAPSPLRQPAKCKHFDACGGCQWQQLDSHQLLHRKAERVRACLLPLCETTTTWHEPFLSPSLWRYRNKMEYSFGKAAHGLPALGLYQNRHRIVDIEECPIAPSWFERALQATRNWWHSTSLQAYHHRSDEGSLRHLMLRESMQGEGRMAVLTVSGNPDYALTQLQIQEFKQALLSTMDDQPPELLTLFVTLQQCIPGQPTRFFEWHLNGPDTLVEKLHIDTGDTSRSFEFTISPTTFFQPNTLAAQELYSKAMRMLKDPSSTTPPSLVWDLFCGSGTLSIIASHQAARVIGIEVNPMAVLDAKANAERNGCSNVTFECADLHKSPKASLEKLLENGRPDAVLVDPPRAGMLEAGARMLAQVAPKRIVYISCNPDSQASDIALLKESGYQLQEIATIDQFPQTGHVETVVLLTHHTQPLSSSD